jgi:hypothetical protein
LHARRLSAHCKAEHVTAFCEGSLLYIANAQNGNVDVLVYVLQVKQGYTVRKMEKDKYSIYIDK